MADIEQKYDLDHQDDGTRSPTKLDYGHEVSPRDFAIAFAPVANVRMSRSSP